MSKVFFHSQEENFLERKRLNELIKVSLKSPLVLVTAPVSFGKTTMIKKYLNSYKSNDYLYFTVRGESEESLWNKFCFSLENIDLSLTRKIKKIGFPKEFKKSKDIIKEISISLINRSLKKNDTFVLVLDDFENEKFKSISQFIELLALENLKELCIILITRENLSFEYLEMQMKNDCRVIDNVDLEFNSHEIKDYAYLNGESLTDAQSEYIYNMTKGWMFLIRLMLNDYKSSRQLDKLFQAPEYIKNVLYDRQTNENKDAVLKLLPVENFTPEQAAYLIGSTDSSLVTSNLIKERTLITIDSKSGKYTIYPLLKESLKQEFKLKRIDEKEIFMNCGEWFESLSDFEQAISYYIKAQDYNKASQLINYLKISSPMDKNLIYLYKIFSALPEEFRFKNVNVYLSFLLSYIIAVDFEKGQKLYKEAKRYYLTKSEMKTSHKLLGDLCFIECILQFNDAEKFLNSVKRTYNYFEGDFYYDNFLNKKFFFGLPNVLFAFYRSPGSLEHTAEIIKECSAYFAKITNGYGIGADFLVQSEYNLLTGDYEAANLLAKKAVYKAELEGQKGMVLSSLFVLLRIAMVYGNKPECDVLIEKIKSLGQTSEIMLSVSQVILGYFYGCTGSNKEMPLWITVENSSNCKLLPKIESVKYIPICLSMIIRGKYIELEVLASTMKDVYETKDNFALGIIYSYIFKCISKWNLNQKEEALEALAKAIKLSEADDIVHLFIELSLYILEPLDLLSKHNRYAKRLLGNCKASKQIFEGKNLEDKNNDFLLTDREIEVVKLIIDGYKQSEIAHMLYVSLPTIKKHVQKIYRKLGVSSKVEAIKLIKTNPTLSRIIPEG